MFKHITLTLLAGLLAGRGAGEERGVTMAADAIYELTLHKTDAPDGGLRLCLRNEGGKFAAGVTVGPLGPTEVDCAGLTLNGNAVSGSLKVTIGFDGYFPKDGKPVVHDCRVNAAVTGATVRGTYEGTVTPGGKGYGTVEGALSAPPDLKGYWIMDLQMEGGRGDGPLGPKSYGERVYPKLFLKDGQFVQNLIYGWGQRVQINYFESEVAANDLRFDGKTLTGALTVKATGGQVYVFTFDGLVVGAQIGGTYKKKVDGKEQTGGPFHGKLQPQPARPLDQALYYLELHQAVLRTWVPDPATSDRLQLMTFVPCLHGTFGSALAYAAAWNHMYDDVDASGLKLEGNALSGELKVTMNPDPYMPPDHKPVPASYAIAAKITDGRIVQGTFTGSFGGMKVSGPVFGELLDQPPVPEPVSLYLKLEDGVNGGSPWHRRTFLNFVATAGRTESGGMSNNKNGWKGTFKKAEVKFDGAVFLATVEGAVDETVGAEKGGYVFKLTGRVVGPELVGTCDTYRDGKLTKSGTAFMGGFGPARK